MKVPVFVILNYGLSGAWGKTHYMFALLRDGSYGPSIQVWEHETAVFWVKSDIWGNFHVAIFYSLSHMFTSDMRPLLHFSQQHSTTWSGPDLTKRSPAEEHSVGARCGGLHRPWHKTHAGNVWSIDLWGFECFFFLFRSCSQTHIWKCMV